MKRFFEHTAVFTLPGWLILIVFRLFLRIHRKGTSSSFLTEPFSMFFFDWLSMQLIGKLWKCNKTCSLYISGAPKKMKNKGLAIQKLIYMKAYKLINWLKRLKIYCSKANYKFNFITITSILEWKKQEMFPTPTHNTYFRTDIFTLT